MIVIVSILGMLTSVNSSYAVNELYCKIDFKKFTTAKLLDLTGSPLAGKTIYGNCIGNIKKTGKGEWNNFNCSEQFKKTMGKSIEDFRNDLIAGPSLLVLKNNIDEFNGEIQFLNPISYKSTYTFLNTILRKSGRFLKGVSDSGITIKFNNKDKDFLSYQGMFGIVTNSTKCTNNKKIAYSKDYFEEESLSKDKKQKQIERKLAALEAKLKENEQELKSNNNIKGKPKSEFPLKSISINFPSSSIKRDDIAVIIGNANYKKMGKDIPNVNPAYADAEGIKQYFMQAKGIKEGNIIYLKDATGSQLASVFGNDKSYKGKLFNYIKPKKSNVYIYYAGHGAPGEKGDAYLVPIDTDSQTIQFTGYQLSTLYSNLGKLPAKSVTVILEACFSGGSQSGSLISKASPIIITPKKTMIPANVKVIAAGSESQMASWEEDSSHSLFTKYFLKAMSGEGDSNKDGKVSDAELKEYLSDTMTYYARRYYGRDQKVQIHNGK
ncbi:caspase family protein [Alphaproteobacteria bacterium]|nr:caspase family protein [Alphaproteobacteria bacterium]